MPILEGMTYTVRCADCQAVIARYDDSDPESKRKADAVSHSCREQRRLNREYAKKREAK